MREIQLTRGFVAIVDDQDYDALSQHKWYARRARNGCHYARRKVRIGPRKEGRFITYYMHRVIAGAPSGALVDHRDRDGLNNRRSNLRICNHSQNGANTPKSARGSSVFKGVGWRQREQRWCSTIVPRGRVVYLGYFRTEIEAALAYDAAAVRIFGEFAYCNFPAPAAQVLVVPSSDLGVQVKAS